MPKRVQLIRHNTGGADAFTGLNGEITVDTTAKELRLHDSLTAGGIPIARKDLANVIAATIAIAGKMTAVQVVELTAATANIAQEIINRVADVDAEETRALAAELVNANAIAAEAVTRAAQDALLIPLTQRNAANGVATLNAALKVVETALLADNLVGLTTAIADLNKVLTTDGVQTVTNKTHTSPVINTGVSGTAIDTDGALAADSDTLLASQKATKAYVDSRVYLIQITTAGTITAQNGSMTVNRVSAGVYDITHNIGNTNYSVHATSKTASPYFCITGNYANNTARITFTDGTSAFDCNFACSIHAW